MKSYIELDVWIEARKLANEIFTVTKSFPNEELYGITSQMRRCAISIASNIAEGSGRQYSKETIHFLYIARGSLYELETQIYLSKDQDLLHQDQFESILLRIEGSKKLLNGFINYYKKK